MWTKFITKLGFGEAAASWKWWAFIIFFVISAVSTFFTTYSLARHKRLVAQLRVQLVAQRAQLKHKESEKKELQLQLKLVQLEKDTKKNKQEREKVRKDIEKTRSEIVEGKKKLDKDIKALPDKKMLELIKQAKKLEQETL